MLETPVILVIATRNKGKLNEIRGLLKDFHVDIKSLDDFGTIPLVEEDGETFDENAYKKSSFTARVLGIPALAEDSGLLIKALGNAPGVYSARYGGENATDEERCAKVLREMNGKTDRRAKFECVISLAVPTGAALTYEASCEGLISEKPAGSKGFGYDPIFYYPPSEKTFAQMESDEKNQVSHRGKALYELKSEFDKVLIWIRQHTTSAFQFYSEGEKQ